mmetsp:Transcript_6777/g.10308  ORF Transcript_6777/g.10308 Transcript_6777/m.10308 type:complete len:394 (-) Transcript_6777:88-1269(-)
MSIMNPSHFVQNKLQNRASPCPFSNNIKRERAKSGRRIIFPCLYSVEDDATSATSASTIPENEESNSESTSTLQSILRKQQPDPPPAEADGAFLNFSQSPSSNQGIRKTLSQSSALNVGQPSAVLKHPHGCQANLTDSNDNSPNLRRPRSKSVSERFVAFNTRVSVIEFERTNEEKESSKFAWFSAKELYQFKCEALCESMMKKRNDFKHRSASVPSLMSWDESKESVLEIRRILVVDPNPTCLCLFKKYFKELLPHCHVDAVGTSKEAIDIFKASKIIHAGNLREGFDIVVIEENLSRRPKVLQEKKHDSSLCTSGSELIAELNKDINIYSASRQVRPRIPLFIGLSCSLKKDGEKLQKSGADLVWSKPPPNLCCFLKQELLRQVMAKQIRK